MRAPFVVILAVALASSACDDKPKDVPVDKTDPKLNLLGVDASVLGESIDPPAPAGDLKAELDHYVNLDTCVAERAKLDPLVGDAIGAIGYDTLLRDACRLLESAKDRKSESCDKIDGSLLRQRCKSWVAILANTPDACPLEFEGLVTRGRVSSCVALASRDVRLCAAESRTGPRTTCEAMVLKDAGKCAALMPAQRLGCQREVTRWRDVLQTPLEGLEKLPSPKATLDVGVPDDAGVPDGGAREIDMSPDVANGVVIITRGDAMRIEIGSLLESEAMHLAAVPGKRQRLGLILAVDPKGASIDRLELVQPNEAAYVVPPAQCDCKLTALKAESKRGTPVSFKLEGKLSAGTRTQTIAFSVTTWARDVVPDSLGTRRTISPHHPVLPSTHRDRDGG